MGKSNSNQEYGLRSKPKISLRAYARRDDSQHVFAWLRFRNIDGEFQDLFLDRSDLHSDTTIRKELLSHGALLPSIKSDRQALFDALREVEPNRRAVIAIRNGWHDDSFVIGADVINKSANLVVRAPESIVGINHYRTSGTLKQWQREVARIAAHSPVMTFGIGAAFASVLLEKIGVAGSVFHLHGPSKVGKTAVLAVAQSVFRNGKREFLDNWDTTIARRDELMANHCDALVVHDELARLPGGANERLAAATDLAFRVSSAKGKGRSVTYTGNEDGLIGRINILSSGEESLMDLANRAKTSPLPGQLVRAFDLEVSASQDFGIFVSLPDEYPTSAEALAALYAAVGGSYGTPVRKFLRMFTRDIDTAVTKANRYIAKFEAEAGIPNNNWERDFARKFALVYAALRLAKRYRVFTIDPNDAYLAAHSAYLSARDSAGSREADMMAALEMLRGCLVSKREIVKVPKTGEVDAKKAKAAIGFRKKHKLFGQVAYLKPHSVEKRLPSSVSMKAVATRLLEDGMLVRNKDGKNRIQLQIQGYKRSRYLCIKARFWQPDEGDEA